MRNILQFFCILFLLSISLLVIADIQDWDALIHKILIIAIASTGAMVVFWGIWQLFNGGAKRLQKKDQDWKRAAEYPLPPLVPSPSVNTNEVTASYQLSLPRYKQFAFTLAKYAIPSAASVIIYSTWSLQNSGFFSIQSATAILVTSISVTLIIGTGWVALLFKRTRVDVHPNGITIQGVINRVTLDNTTNCIMVQQSALGDTGYGTLYVNRASGKKCRVWNDFIDVELDNLVLSTLPKIRANVHDKPNRDIAPYVSLNHKISSGHLAVVMYVIILIITSTLML